MGVVSRHSRRSAHCFPRQAHQNSHVEERHSRKIVLTDASEKVSKRYAGLSEWWWVSSSLYSSRVSSEPASAAASSEAAAWKLVSSLLRRQVFSCLRL